MTMNEQAIQKTKTGALHRMIRTDEFGVLIPLIGIVVVTTALRPAFLSVGNFSSMFTQLTFIRLTAFDDAVNTRVAIGRIKKIL